MNFNINIGADIEIYFLAIPIILAIALAILAYRNNIKDFYFRSVFFLLLALILLNPVVMREIRNYVPSKVIAVLDNSDSMNIANRKEITAEVMAELEKQLKENNIELVTINSNSQAIDRNNRSTNLFAALFNNLMAVPLNRVVGTIFITDGQVHDVPSDDSNFKQVMPLNAVIIGARNEFDYKIEVTSAPKYALVGDVVSIAVKVDIEGKSAIRGDEILLTVTKDGEYFISKNILVGVEENFEFQLGHAGQNVFEFEIPLQQGELTEINNKTAALVNGIRDRLKVLLVSGKPHMGERAWRNLLKSDTAVDLVHFTILRSPFSFDLTPSNDLSLIAFPVEELFERKINEFDLIIFDKYVHYGMLNDRYFSNIAEYVRSGGSFLFSMDSDRIEAAIFDSELANILPVSNRIAEQEIIKGNYLPAVTEKGKFHAITSNINLETQGLKEWNNQVSLKQTSGEVLMQGLKSNPLLIADKVGEGRVALLASDNIWLWSKYPASRGLYIELQRNIAHWLMKEPELEEGYIKITRRNNIFEISQRVNNNKAENNIINIVMPNGDIREIEMSVQGAWLNTNLDIEYNGIYKFYNDRGSAFALAGSGTGKEFTSMISIDAKLRNIVRSSGGNVVWQNKGENLNINRFNFNTSKRAYSVTGINRIGLFSPIIYILLILLGFIYIWKKESN